MNFNINGRLNDLTQDENEQAFRFKLFSEIDREVNSEEALQYIYELYFQIMAGQVAQFQNDTQKKGEFFKKLAENKLYTANLLRILKTLWFCYNRCVNDNAKTQLNKIITTLSRKTSETFLELLEKFSKTRNRFYTKTDDQNNKIQYCMLDIDDMMSMHENKDEMVLVSRANTCATGGTYSASLNSLRMGVGRQNDFAMSFYALDMYECSHIISEGKSSFEKLKDALQDMELGTSSNDEKLSMDESDILKVLDSFKDLSDSRSWPELRTRFKLDVFNVCIRGKGSGDTSLIDVDAKDNILCRLNFGLSGNDKLKIQKYRGANFLFEQVSQSKDSGNEPYSYLHSVLNDNGKQITKRVLDLLLPLEDYKLNSDSDNGQMRVTESKQSKYQKLGDKMKKINDLVLSYNKQATQYRARAHKYKKAKDSENEEAMRRESQKYKDLENKIFSELEEALDRWQLEFCPNGYLDLPKTESDFRKQLESDTDAYKDLRECFRKTFKLEKDDIDKNMFDDMLITTLYKYTAAIHNDSEVYPDAQKKDQIMNYTRRTFWEREKNGKLNSDAITNLNFTAQKYFDYMHKLTIEPPSKVFELPGNFFEYDEGDPDKMYTALNYIQILIQAAVVVAKIDTADKATRAKFNRNANRLVWVFEDTSTKAKNYYQNLKTKINKYISNHQDVKRQEVLVGLLCNGIPNLTKTKTKAICDMAYKITVYDLDNPTRGHTTQLNCVRAKRDKDRKLVGCDFSEDGILSVEVNLSEQLKKINKFSALGLDKLTQCETKAEMKATLDAINWDDFKDNISAEAFLIVLNDKVPVPRLGDVMRDNWVRPFLWSQDKYVKYIFSKSYSIKCAALSSRFWVFGDNDRFIEFDDNFMLALMQRVAYFFPCVFFLILALVFYPFSRYNTNRIYRFVEQTVRTKLGDKVNDINPDKDKDENKNQELKQNDLDEQKSDDFLKDLDFDLFNIKTDQVVQPVHAEAVVPIIEPVVPIMESGEQQEENRKLINRVNKVQ